MVVAFFGVHNAQEAVELFITDLVFVEIVNDRFELVRLELLGSVADSVRKQLKATIEVFAFRYFADSCFFGYLLLKSESRSPSVEKNIVSFGYDGFESFFDCQLWLCGCSRLLLREIIVMLALSGFFSPLALFFFGLVFCSGFFGAFKFFENGAFDDALGFGQFVSRPCAIRFNPSPATRLSSFERCDALSVVNQAQFFLVVFNPLQVFRLDSERFRNACRSAADCASAG